MERFLLLFALSVFCATSVHAEEIWLCDGFVYSDGSSSVPFIMKADGQTLEFHLEVEGV